MKGDSTAHQTDVLHLFLSYTPYMKGGSDSLERPSPPKNRATRNLIIGSNQSGPPSNRLRRWSHVACFVTGSSRRLTFCAKQTPKQWELDHYFLHLSFFHLMKRKVGHMMTQQDFSEEMAEVTFIRMTPTYL